MNLIDQIATAPDIGSAQQEPAVLSATMKPTEVVKNLNAISENTKRINELYLQIMDGHGRRTELLDIVKLAESTINRARLLLAAEGK